MLSWIKRVALDGWRILDALAESANPSDQMFAHHTGRMDRLEARLAHLESADGGRPYGPKEEVAP
jgi:hypothetical protein